MSERALTREEVEELFEQLALRPSMWFGKDLLWVRKDEGENWFALKAKNGLPNGMYALHTVILKPGESSKLVERYVDRLLSGLTSYGTRKRAERYLEERLGLLTGDSESVAKDLAEIFSGNSVVVEHLSPITTSASNTPWIHPPSPSEKQATKDLAEAVVKTEAKAEGDRCSTERKLAPWLRKLLEKTK